LRYYRIFEVAWNLRIKRVSLRISMRKGKNIGTGEII